MLGPSETALDRRGDLTVETLHYIRRPGAGNCHDVAVDPGPGMVRQRFVARPVRAVGIDAKRSHMQLDSDRLRDEAHQLARLIDGGTEFPRRGGGVVIALHVTILQRY